MRLWDWLRPHSPVEASMRTVVEEAVKRAVASMAKDAELAWASTQQAANLTRDVTTLRTELETMRIEKSRREEEFQRRERDVEHMLGLERRRQEQELTLAKREALITTREEALKADRTRFDEQMKFHETRFTEEVGYLKELMKNVLDRLPDARMSFSRKEESAS